MAVPDAVLLFAMRRAHARIHIEHDAARRTASMNAIDPSAGKISKSGKVLFGCEPARLEAAHLARRGRATMRRLTADNPARRQIMTQTLGVVHIFVSSKTAESCLCRLSKFPSSCEGRRLKTAEVGSLPSDPRDAGTVMARCTWGQTRLPRGCEGKPDGLTLAVCECSR